MGNPTVTINGITLYGSTQRADGVYQIGPKFFQDWYSTSPTKTPRRERPAQDGAFGRDRTFRSALPLAMSGWARGANWPVLMTALAAAVSTGTPMTVTVADAVGTSSRTVTVEDFVPYPNPGANRFEFDLTLTAEDPNRYGPVQTSSCGVPTAGAGMPWPQVWPVVWGSTTVTRTNYALNPNFETDTASWLALSGATPSRVTSQFYSGAASLQVVTPGAAAGEGSYSNPATISGFAAGGVHSSSLRVKAPVGAQMEIVAATTGTGGSTTTTRFTGTGAWQLVKAEGSVASSGANPYIVIRTSTAAAAQAVTFYVDEALIELAATVGAYFDGGYQSAPDPTLFTRWTGVANESAAQLYQVTGGGNSGRATAPNTGSRPTPLLLTVAGGLSSGVDLVEITTGKHLTLNRVIPAGSSAIFDASIGRVYLDQPSNDITGFLSAAEWSGFQIPAGGQSVVQFNPLGTVTGTPLLTLQWAPAN